MIRLFLLATGFLSVTIALLISQLGDDDDAQIASREVTRADMASGLQPGDLGGVRQTPVTVPATTGSADAPQMDAMFRSIVSEYRRPVTGDRLRQAATSTGGTDDGMRALTDGVLAGLGALRLVAAENPVSTGPKSLNALIVQAMREGQSDAYVDAILNEAVGNGRVTAPEALVTSSGEVDTATLLDSLVQRSVAPKAAPEAVVATRSATPALPDIAPAIDEVLTYRVQPGDSLAGIALRHYGTTTAYEIIYQANRDQLPSPGAVRPGMILTIPAL